TVQELKGLQVKDTMDKMQAVLDELQKGIPQVCGRRVIIKASNGKFVSGHNGVTPICADCEHRDRATQFMVEHAGFGKVALRSRGKYLSSEDGRMPMMCNRNVVLEWERFVYVEHPEGTCSHAATMEPYLHPELFFLVLVSLSMAAIPSILDSSFETLALS
ncbi:hypothetical protein AAVH_34407, partial [Aphelenchoides avenae]